MMAARGNRNREAGKEREYVFGENDDAAAERETIRGSVRFGVLGPSENQKDGEMRERREK